MHGNQRQTDWAYMAGIMDADGCFMITKHNRKWKGHKISPTYLPCLKISMVEEEAIQFITDDMNIGNYKLDRTRKRNYPDGRTFGSKPLFDWFIRNRKQLIPVLEQLIPYLKVKKNRAIHLLNYCKNVFIKNRGNNRIPEEELNYREDAYLRMRKFNGSKVAATTES
jgi:hypothetical protein